MFSVSSNYLRQIIFHPLIGHRHVLHMCKIAFSYGLKHLFLGGIFNRNVLCYI